MSTEKPEPKLEDFKPPSDFAERQRTFRFVTGCICGTIGLAIVTAGWAYVEVQTADEPWAEVVLGICGPTGSLVVLAGLYLGYLKFRMWWLARQLDIEIKATKAAATAPSSVPPAATPPDSVEVEST